MINNPRRVKNPIKNLTEGDSGAMEGIALRFCRCSPYFDY